MSWEYMIVDLAAATFKRTEADILSDVGAAGWECVQIIHPYRAVLKRAIEDQPQQIESSSGHVPAAVKYRDPQTGETWTGSGKRASWHAAKVSAGERAERSLVTE